MTDEAEPRKWPRAIVPTVQAIAAGSGEPLAGALAALLPIVWDVHQQRYEDFIKDATRGIEDEEFLRRVTRDSKFTDLFADAARAAAETDLHEKRRALAAILRQGLFREDDARLDEERMMLQALRPLEVPHLKILDLMRHEQTMKDGGKVPVGTPWGWELLHEFYSEAGTLLEPLVRQLEGLALLIDDQPASTRSVTNARWTVTAFGQRVYGFLEEAADESA